MTAPASASPRLGCHRAHVRRLTVATIVFVLAAGAIAWGVMTFILRDMSQEYLEQVISAAKDEAEAVARMANDPSMGEGEPVASADVDPQAVLEPLLPKFYDEAGQRVDPLGTDGPAAGRLQDGSEAPPATEVRTPAHVKRQGQEWRTLVNGQLFQSHAIHVIEIHSDLGVQTLQLRKTEQRNLDPKILNDPAARWQNLGMYVRPSSQRLNVSWETTLDDRPVTMLARLDATRIEEGVEELRRRVIPKLAIGGGLFVLLLGVAYGYVVSLLGSARRLEAASNQQVALAQVGVLAAGLAHEIRNPLSAVQMNLQLLEEDLGGPGPNPASAEGEDEPRAVLRSTQRELRRLGSLVSDFLAYARPAEPRRAPHRIDHIVRDCVELFEADAAESGIEIVADVSHAGDDAMMIDEAMLKQALMNVLVNALQVVPKPGGQVSVAVRQSGGMCRIAVSDNGPGLPSDPDLMFRVFHSTKKGGTGLGLPISRALVERLGGSLTARAGERGGAVFDIAIPCEAA